MSKTLFLNFQNNQILEGFRKCDEFLLRHNNTLNMLSDERWRENKYMNTEKHISSPTNLIIGRYICNILSALLIDLSMDVYSNIFVECQSKDGLDSYSKYIFSVLDFVTNINIKYIELSNLVQDTQTISADLMRNRIKRGLYDSFTYEDSILYKIYSIYCSIFKNDKISLTEIENLFLNTEDRYESWLLQKILINLGVRIRDKQLVGKYLLELEKNNVSKYDYWNSYSFYLLYFYSKESSTNYLSKKLDADRFLDKVEIDYAESLVFKNYATILEDDLIKKKLILEKCLSQTPQDVDLWKFYLTKYGSSDEITKKFSEIFNSGYSEPQLLEFLRLSPHNIDELVRSILLCSTKQNRQVAFRLLELVEDDKLNQYLKKYLTHFEFPDYM